MKRYIWKVKCNLFFIFISSMLSGVSLRCITATGICFQRMLNYCSIFYKSIFYHLSKYLESHFFGLTAEEACFPLNAFLVKSVFFVCEGSAIPIYLGINNQIQYIFTILKAFRPIETLESLYVPFICQLAQLRIDRVHCVLARFPSLQTGIVGDPLRIPNIFTSQNLPN